MKSPGLFRFTLFALFLCFVICDGAVDGKDVDVVDAGQASLLAIGNQDSGYQDIKNKRSEEKDDEKNHGKGDDKNDDKNDEKNDEKTDDETDDEKDDKSDDRNDDKHDDKSDHKDDDSTDEKKDEKNDDKNDKSDQEHETKDPLARAGGALFIYRAVPQTPSPNDTYLITTDPLPRHETCPDTFHHILAAPPRPDQTGIHIKTSILADTAVHHAVVNVKDLGSYSVSDKPPDANADWKPPPSSAPWKDLPFLNSTHARIGSCTRWPVVVVRPLRCLVGDKGSYMAMLELSCTLDTEEAKPQDA